MHEEIQETPQATSLDLATRESSTAAVILPCRGPHASRKLAGAICGAHGQLAIELPQVALEDLQEASHGGSHGTPPTRKGGAEAPPFP